MRVDDMAGNGPDRYCSPRHRMPFNSRNEGPIRVSMTWRAMREREVRFRMYNEAPGLRPGPVPCPWIPGGQCNVWQALPQLVQHGDEERGGLAGAGAGHGHDVRAAERDGDGLALDGRGDAVPLALDCAEHLREQISEQGLMR
jgi:hypothetical protein